MFGCRVKKALLTNTNPQVKDMETRAQEELAGRVSGDGTAVHGVLLLPATTKRVNRYKTVVHVHGGPEEAGRQGFMAPRYDWGGGFCISRVCGTSS